MSNNDAWPAPSGQPTDADALREAVEKAKWKHDFLAGLDAIVQASDELRTLREICAPEWPVEITVTSSNKYTRVRVPRLRKLPVEIDLYLQHWFSDDDNIHPLVVSDYIQYILRVHVRVEHTLRYGVPYKV